ncbi:fused DSP-PTPase phosphatase/NAD kinase-like protein [Pseudoroseicyclus aestuarii]|uniref:Tyrosine phosphatase family protein n=1 Tax=Pseudoroseicyclus aestuarii TaxID=1795041 RepID=A0A318T072_9RHOB|nr:tyrosine-protein phosphatase [Pseudoroseicyclus aestuarii]PYE85457.1 tyrosine phosphatase family protein [Pseudoroseicyclus aestuarii]
MALFSRIAAFQQRIRHGAHHHLGDAEGRFFATMNLIVHDHVFLRRYWTNEWQVAPGVWRSNHPTHGRLERFAHLGVRSVINLRGEPQEPSYLFETESCAQFGMTLVTTKLNANKPPQRENLLRLFDLFRSVERPFMMHCKSGADRAGLASALYLLAHEGADVETAKTQLHWRYLHLRRGKTGVLDHILDVYAARHASASIGIEDWVATEYDPQSIKQSYKRKRGLA